MTPEGSDTERMYDENLASRNTLPPVGNANVDREGLRNLMAKSSF